jgi:hypothetical protein
MRGRTLSAPAWMWMQTNSAAGSSAGKLETSALTASMPPDEAPMTTMSCPRSSGSSIGRD